MQARESIAACAAALIQDLMSAGKTIATAESCTGGWIAKALTDVAGSSAVFGYGVVSYSNDAKESLLNVDKQIIRDDGAVSERVVRNMAQGIVQMSGADIAVAVSGIAGPGGGTQEKPVGTVWFGWAWRGEDGVQSDAERQVFPGDRRAVREHTVLHALTGSRARLSR